MFFDVVKTQIDVNGLLMELIQKQHNLWINDEMEETTDILELKKRIKEAQGQNYSTQGIAWWDLPWEKVYQKLIADTTLPVSQSTKSWEWEYELKQDEKDGVFLLYLQEHGRSYGVDIHIDEWEYNQDSKYSASERADMVRDFNRQINKYEFFRAATTEGRVHSSLTDQVYDSMSDYYLSTEHWMIREHFSDKFARSLYTERWTHHLAASSNNLHVKRAYGVACYHINNGFLDFMQTEGFRLIGSAGPNYGLGDSLIAGKDPVVLCAKYMADSEQILSVPVHMFCMDMKDRAGTYEEAMRQAEVFACLAGKLSYELGN